MGADKSRQIRRGSSTITGNIKFYIALTQPNNQ